MHTAATHKLTNAEHIRARIQEVAVATRALSPMAARDVAFHMTDWSSDLAAYVGFCLAPDAYAAEEVDRVLERFLAHAPNHIASAAKLYGERPGNDVFESGAAGEPRDEKIHHKFLLRQDVEVTFKLPSDLSSKEAKRLCLWLKSIPLDGEIDDLF